MGILDNMNLRLEEEQVDTGSSLDITELEDLNTEEMDSLGEDFNKATESYIEISKLNTEHMDHEYIRNTIIYTCGRLGVNYNETMKTIKTESFNLHLESGLNDFFDRVRTVVIKIFSKIKEFFEKVWIRVQAWYYTLTSSLFNLRKKIYSLRTRENIKIDAKKAEEFINDFKGYLSIMRIRDEDAVKTMTNLSIAVQTYLSTTITNNRYDLISDFVHLFQQVNNINGTIDQKSIDKYKEELSYLMERSSKRGQNLLWYTQDRDPYDYKYHILSYINVPYNVSNSTETVCLDKEGHLSTSFIFAVDKDKPSREKYVKYDILDKQFLELDFTMLQRLAECTDGLKTVMNGMTGLILKADSEIKKMVKNLEKQDNKEVKNIISDMIIVSRDLCFNYARSLIQHVRVITKWIKYIYKQAKESTSLGIKEFYNSLKNSNESEIKVANLVIKNPKDAKLVEKGDIVYINPGKATWEQFSNGSPGGVAVVAQSAGFSAKDGDMNKADILTGDENEIAGVDPKTNEKITKKEVRDMVNIAKLGLIFIDEEGVMDKNNPLNVVFGITGDIRFVYYHELGHLMTGQHENPPVYYKPKHVTNEDMCNGFINYAYNRNENLADAYACLKCGLSPKKVAEARHKYAVEAVARLNMEITPLLRKKMDVAKIDMEKNITNCIKDMRSFVKLTPFEYIKSKYYSKTKK